MYSSIAHEKSLRFAVRIVRLYQYLEGKNEYVLSKQILLLRQLYIRKLPLTRYCRSNNCHAFRLPRKGREKRHFNHLINAALQSSVYGHFIAALIRSGTSIGANLAEAKTAISRKDFQAKVYIALKECSETLYWLELLKETDYISGEQYQSLYSDCEDLRRILSTTTRTLTKSDAKGTERPST